MKSYALYIGACYGVAGVVLGYLGIDAFLNWKHAIKSARAALNLK